MTITFPHQPNDHHVRVTAIALTFVVVLAAAGLTFWQGSSVTSGSSSAAVETAQAEPFSPEKARIYTQASATQTKAVASHADVQRQAIESSLPNAARAASIGAVGKGHPDIHRATGGTNATSSVTEGPQATAASFAAFDAPAELKEYALTQSVSDWVVDYDKAEQILQSFTRWNPLEPYPNQSVEAQGNALDQLPANCAYWGNCTPE